ncbi:hypothetical protein M501DRAFT_931235 [Patellaria atrata CBS 101060]|uniref:DUF218 domain-containing protein n=1 Tax=Patellaria atrata CBS 101060 TaxID=1346257 RepID=A0A9P4VNT6_9PEZI|nr:hypothetical protein M501DRAFT_931235 [Patellaria atrata CBS 101060]
MVISNPPKSIVDLVVVCCHAIWNGHSSSSPDPYKEKQWILKGFQRSNRETGKQGEHLSFMRHINEAMLYLLSTDSELQNDPAQTLVMFSGGPTSKETDISEAFSYWKALHTWDHVEIMGQLYPNGRIMLEEHSTDSYQNFIFSVLEFRKQIGHYPRNIHIITHGFKGPRFLDLHAKALQWPKERISVYVRNPEMSRAELEETIALEKQNGYLPFVSDPYGAHASLLDKRKVRCWDETKFRAYMSPLLNEGEEGVLLTRLLDWKGGESGDELFPDTLPWNETSSAAGSS